MNETHRKQLSLAIRVCAAVAAVSISAAFTLARADDGRGLDGDEARIRKGFEIAPVPLILAHKNRDMVGLGSYLVNGVAGCNGCHTANPATEYTAAGNPYFRGAPPQIVNQSTYLGGGRNFGPLVAGLTPDIISRNLTPDRTGRPVGGRSFAEFKLIMQTGADLDHIHPTCSAKILVGCFPAFLPFDGDLLQIMPWPIYQHMSVRDLRAMYEYLSAIPCIAGPDKGVLHNDCY
jgi:hypothetical protein